MREVLIVCAKKIVPGLIALVMFSTVALSPLVLCAQEQNNRRAGIDGSLSFNYTVKKGDTLYDIAREYRVELSELMKVNGRTGYLIRPGDLLVLPKGNLAPVSSSQGRVSGNISEEELILLAKLIHAEARGESFLGQVAVGAVIMNRLASPHFPKTITKVIYQRSNRVYQFSPVADGSINLEPDMKAVYAALQALHGYDPTDGALFFYNPDLSKDRWIVTLPVITRIGNHVFATSI